MTRKLSGRLFQKGRSMPIDQPPQQPQVSEVRYAKEQDKQRQRRDEERKRAQDADNRLKTKQTSQNK